MELYKDNGCKCKDSDQICSNMKYIAVHKKSIQKVKEDYSVELTVFKVFGKIILGKEVSDTLINNWAKTKLYYCKCLSEITIQSMKVVKAKNILQSFDSMGKVDQDLKQGKDLLILTYSLYMQGAKTLLFDKESEDSKRILIASNSHSIFNNFNIQSITKTEFIEILQKVYHNMGTSYTPVRITSGYRTIEYQAKIMCDMLEWDTNMYEYYNKNYAATPYIKIVQNLYDGEIHEDEINKFPAYGDIIVSLIPLLNVPFPPEVSQDNIYINGNPYARSLVKQAFYKRREICQHLLILGMKQNMGNPSYHTSGQAFDIELNKSGSEGKAYELHTGGKGVTENSNNPHYHLTLK